MNFPPKPALKHLELQRQEIPENQPSEPAPPIAHAGLAGLRKVRTSPTKAIPTSPETKSSDIAPVSTEGNVIRSSFESPERKGIRLPWDKKEPRPQDGIASGLATTLGFGAAAVSGDAAAKFRLPEETGPRKSDDK